jgi:hypothetical protein
MTRKEAKKMARSRDCSCVKGKDRDNNYDECIDKVFDWHERVVKKLDVLKQASSKVWNDCEQEKKEDALSDDGQRFTVRGIIEQLKEQREKAKDTFIENSFIKRNCKPDAPCPDTDANLDAIAELNRAISILENHSLIK